MARWIGNQLHFDRHEVAWSARTANFPIFAARRDGDRVVICRAGYTREEAFAVTLPKGFHALIRYFRKGWYSQDIIYFPNGDIVVIDPDNVEEMLEHPDIIVRTFAYSKLHCRWPDWVVGDDDCDYARRWIMNHQPDEIPEVKLIGDSWAWALFQAGQAWMAWDAAGELEGLGHPHLAGVYRKYARELAQLARPFVEELARHNVARVIYQRVSAILNLSKEEVQNVP